MKSLRELTVMDPCMGSGHFLREAFDMLAAMYREQEPGLSAANVADRILTHHLHGVDIDPRAAQLAALTLYLRAWELVREEQRARRRLGPVVYRPPAMNLAATPTGLSAGALERHLRRHPEDLVFKPLLEGIFAALEKADLLGSLLQPEAQLNAAIAKLQQPHTIGMDFDADQADLRRTITDLASRDPAELKGMLLDRIAATFAAEVGSSDVAADLFGREAQQGVRLLKLLDQRCAVVATNPPYMNSKNMPNSVKTFVESGYSSAKRDLYAAFILRCLQSCSAGGRIAMVTQQGWMFLGSFAGLRACREGELTLHLGKMEFTGLLRETSIDCIAHLGRYAFSELGNAVIAPVMFVLKAASPMPRHRIWACRLVAPRPSEDQAALLSRAGLSDHSAGMVFTPVQADFLDIPETPLVYWLAGGLFDLLAHPSQRFARVVTTRYGMNTGENSRFLRYFWEMHAPGNRWVPYAKGGGYGKWAGMEWFLLDWREAGDAIRATGHAKVQNAQFYFREGVTYSLMAGGAVGARHLPEAVAFDSASLTMFPLAQDTTSLEEVMSVANSRVTSYVLRLLASDIKFNPGYVDRAPFVYAADRCAQMRLVDDAIALKNWLVSLSPTERVFSYASLGGATESAIQAAQSTLHTLEGLNERLVCDAYGLELSELTAVLDETGAPCGWHPIVSTYDTLPPLPRALGTENPHEIPARLDLVDRMHPDSNEFDQIKISLKLLYEAVSGANATDTERSSVAAGNCVEHTDEDSVSGAHVPIPAESFLEELSQKLQIHPISVYWLLEELRAEGVRCRPEEKRLLEDRLSVLTLRLLGYRWPKQVESGEPVPDWADTDGIILIAPGAGESTMAERLRERLRAEEGDLGAQRAEALLQELTGFTLEEWVRRQFFPRHVRQFRSRPVAWHVASPLQGGGGKRKGARRQPAFECMVYYHACAGDVLARLRSHYLQPLILVEQRRAEDARKAGDETRAALAAERITELEAFAAKLRQVDEEGFACSELDELIVAEPLNRWSGDGHQPPHDRDELLRRERAWRVDTNDGVRVNIAPLQLGGVLAADVLRAADARKAIADRARWRADERRWVREGKLPRCGWMGDDVPESPRWRELAPQREAERRKLEEKREAASERLI